MTTDGNVVIDSISIKWSKKDIILLQIYASIDRVTIKLFVLEFRSTEHCSERVLRVTPKSEIPGENGQDILFLKHYLSK